MIVSDYGKLDLNVLLGLGSSIEDNIYECSSYYDFYYGEDGEYEYDYD